MLKRVDSRLVWIHLLQLCWLILSASYASPNNTNPQCNTDSSHQSPVVPVYSTQRLPLHPLTPTVNTLPWIRLLSWILIFTWWTFQSINSNASLAFCFINKCSPGKLCSLNSSAAFASLDIETLKKWDAFLYRLVQLWWLCLLPISLGTTMMVVIQHFPHIPPQFDPQSTVNEIVSCLFQSLSNWVTTNLKHFPTVFVCVPIGRKSFCF